MAVSDEQPISAANLKVALQSVSSGGGSSLTAIPSDQMYSSAPIYCGVWEIGTNASNGVFRIGGFYDENVLFIGTVYTGNSWTATSKNYIYVKKGSSGDVKCSGEPPIGALPTLAFDGRNAGAGSMSVSGNTFYPHNAYGPGSTVALNCFFY